MKRYLSNFKLTEQFVLKSMLECLSHKTNNKVRWDRKDTSYFLADYYIKGDFAELKNIHEAANFIHNDIHNNFTFYHDVLAPYIARELFLEIKNRNIQLSPINYQERVDPEKGVKQIMYAYMTNIFSVDPNTVTETDIKSNPDFYLDYEEEKEKDLSEKVAVLEEANMELTATIDNILTDVIPSLMGI